MSNLSTLSIRTEHCAHVWLKSKQLGVALPAVDVTTMNSWLNKIEQLDFDILLLQEELAKFSYLKRSSEDPALRMFYDKRFKEQHAVQLAKFSELDSHIQRGDVGISLLSRSEIESGVWQMYLFPPEQDLPIHTAGSSSPRSRH